MIHDILVYGLTSQKPMIPVAAFPGNLWTEASPRRLLERVQPSCPVRKSD